MNTDDLELGSIYYISYGENTQVVGRLFSIGFNTLIFNEHFHYWNGFEKFHKGGHCMTGGIEEIRRANKPEKHSLLRAAIENNTI